MVDTLNNIKIAAGTPVDIYAASGISVGRRLILQNIGVCDVELLSQSATPTRQDFTDSKQIVRRSEWVINDSGDVGAWAYCNNENGLINVREA